MPITIDTAVGPVRLFEMWDDFKKGIDIQRGPYVEQTYITDRWADTDAVCNALMGSTSTSGSSTVHVPGFPCPTSKNLTCTDAYVVGEAEYDAKDGGHVQFNLPKIRVVYGIRSWEQLATDDPQGYQSFPGDGPATYAIHSMDFGVEAVKLPGSAYKFVSDPPKPCDIPIIKQVGVCRLNVELKKVPFLPTLTIMNLMGKLNDDTFFGAPRGQVQFMGARTSKEFESDGTRVQNVSYSFRFRKASWNLFLRPDNAKWDFIKTSEGKYPYEYADLRPLIALQGYAQMVALGYTDTYGQEAFV